MNHNVMHMDPIRSSPNEHKTYIRKQSNKNKLRKVSNHSNADKN